MVRTAHLPYWRDRISAAAMKIAAPGCARLIQRSSHHLWRMLSAAPIEGRLRERRPRSIGSTRLAALGRSRHEERTALSFVSEAPWPLLHVKTRMTTDRFCKTLRLRCYNFSASWKSYAMHVFNSHQMFWSTPGQPMATFLTTFAPVREA